VKNIDKQKLTTPTRALSWHSMLTLYFSLVIYAVIYNYLLLKENLTESIIILYNSHMVIIWAMDIHCTVFRLKMDFSTFSKELRTGY